MVGGGEMLGEHLGQWDKVCHRSQFKVPLRQNGFNLREGCKFEGRSRRQVEEMDHFCFACIILP